MRGIDTQMLHYIADTLGNAGATRARFFVHICYSPIEPATIGDWIDGYRSAFQQFYVTVGRRNARDVRFGSRLCKNADTETNCATIESGR
jgi:hypothetical protein